MSTDVTRVVEPRTEGGARGGAVAYAQALSVAGGEELPTHKSPSDGSALYAALYVAPPYSLDVPPLPVPRLAVNLTSAKVRGGFHGDRPRNFDARRYSMFLTPADQPVSWCKESASRHLMIYFHPEVYSGTGEDFQPVPALFNTTVPGVGRLIEEFSEELQTPGALNAEAADCLARLLLIRLAREQHRRPTVSPALTPTVIARLRDYVIAHVTERILVADLAKVAGLSPNYFAQSFTEHAGSSPHQFVLRLRVQRAVDLLTRSTSSLADVAHDCGFASQQHMCSALRRHLHTTPGRIRGIRANGPR